MKNSSDQPKFLGFDVGELVRRLRGVNVGAEETLPQVTEAFSAEARLRLVMREGKFVDVYSTLGESRLFSLQGVLAGALEIFTLGDEGRGRKIISSIPIDVKPYGRHRLKVTLTCPADANPTGELLLSRASLGRVPPSSQLVEVLFTAIDDEYRYVFEFDERISIADFKDVPDRRPLFRTTPPVSQMSAFLRAITHERRDLTRILADIASVSGSQSTRETVAFLQSNHSHHATGEGGPLEGLRRLLESHGRKVSAPTLAALGLFMDLERGALTADTIARLSEIGQPLEITPLACLAVARHFGIDVTEEEWEDCFAATCSDPYEFINRMAHGDEIEGILESLRTQQGGRTTIQVLEDLAQQSKSSRVQTFVSALQPHLPAHGAFQANDVQLVLLSILDAIGRPVRPSTLTALCLFVDVEVGHVTEELLGKVIGEADRLESSMYAMMAVAGAFDVGLRGFFVANLSWDPGRFLSAVTGLAEDGVLACCHRLGAEGRWWRWVRTPADVAALLADQLEFTGEILGRFPLLDQVDEPDLEAFLESGETFLVRFRSDLDGTSIWKKMNRHFFDIHVRTSPDSDTAAGSVGFVESFTSYHFIRMIMVVTEEMEDASLIGRRRLVAVYTDSRGNPRFRCIPQVRSVQDLQAPAGSGLEYSHKVIRFPEIAHLPETLQELRHDHLLGRSNALSREIKILNLMHASLLHVLTRHPEYVSFLHRRDLRERVIEAFVSDRVTHLLAPLLDASSKDRMESRLLEETGADFLIYRPLVEASIGIEGQVLLALWLTWEVSRSHGGRPSTFLRESDEEVFRHLISDCVYELLHAQDPHVRSLAARLVATVEEMCDEQAKEIARYELTRALSDPDPEVTRAAADGLTYLSFGSVVSLPRMVRLEPGEDEPSPWGLPIDNHVDRISRVMLPLLEDHSMKTRRSAKAGAAKPGDKAHRLAHLLSVVYAAFEKDGSLKQERYLCILPPWKAALLKITVLEAWKVMALSLDTRLATLVDSLGPDGLFNEFKIFLSERGDTLAAELGASPFLGGRGNPVTIYRLSPGNLLDRSIFARTAGRTAPSPAKLQTFPLVRDLAELIMALPNGEIDILQVVGDTAADLLEVATEEVAFSHRGRLEPHDLRILNPRHVLFKPLIHEDSLRQEQVGWEEADWEDFDALVALYRTYSVAEPSGREEARAGRDALRGLATGMTRVFGLPPDYDRQVTNMLLSVSPHSLYPLR